MDIVLKSLKSIIFNLPSDINIYARQRLIFNGKSNICLINLKGAQEFLPIINIFIV